MGLPFFALGLSRRRLLLSTGLGAFAASASSQSLLQRLYGQPQYLPLPALASPITLRVVYAHNPRIERAPPELLAQVLTRTAELVQAHFGRSLQFSSIDEHPVHTLFSGVTAEFWNTTKTRTYDFKYGTGDRKRLVETTAKNLPRELNALNAQIAFAKPHLLSHTVPTNAQTLAKALIDTQLARYASWTQLQAIDGRPLLDDSPLHEYLGWTSAPLLAPWPFEIVLTNQLMASVEYLENFVHSALRGGVSAGLTMPSPASRYATVSVLSLFPMLSQDTTTRALRGDSATQNTDAAEAAAALLTHELGHQLLHLGHPFGHAACVMSPPELLRFSQWTRHLSAQACQLGNTPENTAGVVRFVEPKKLP